MSQNNKSKINLFHITHWKAGSQWIYKILQGCAPEKIVEPTLESNHFLKANDDGRIFPTLYLGYEEFSRVKTPANSKRMVVIRDLRDTLISLYFSMKHSHPLEVGVQSTRVLLNNFNSIDDGLIFLLHHWLYSCAIIQFSWYVAKEPLIKYEDLLKNDVDILLPILSPCFDLPENVLVNNIESNRFEALTKNRKRGDEDVNAHERKGIEGDWKNHFSEKVKSEFKEKYGDLLIKLGYESDHNW